MHRADCCSESAIFRSQQKTAEQNKSMLNRLGANLRSVYLLAWANMLREREYSVRKEARGAMQMKR